MFKLRILLSYLRTKYFQRFKTRDAFLRWQEKKVLKHLNWVRSRSSFYNERFDGKSSSTYRELPFLDKAIMMTNFSRLNTVGIDREEALNLAFKAEETRDFAPTLNGVTVGLSSGTSGNRGLFLVSDEERANYIGFILAKILPGSILHKYKVAFFMRANSNLYEAAGKSRIQFQFYDLLQPIRKNEEDVNGFNPDILLAPPSMLLKLAQAQKEGRIALKPVKIVSIAETLDPLDEKFISAVFRQKIHQVYQCTEGFLGITCDHGTLHLNEDMSQIEPYWLDEEKTKFMPVITDFTRKSQPLIRYRLNDILTVKEEPCPCGSVLTALECIEGRMDDLIYFLDEKKERVTVFPDFLRRAMIQAHSGIETYLIRQQEEGNLTISIQCEEALRTEVESRIREEAEKLSERVSAQMPGLTFSKEFPEIAGKKLRRVVQELRS